MRFKTTLSVPNLHLSVHVLCERGVALDYHFGVKLRLQFTKFRIFSDEHFCQTRWQLRHN